MFIYFLIALIAALLVLVAWFNKNEKELERSIASTNNQLEEMRNQKEQLSIEIAKSEAEISFLKQQLLEKSNQQEAYETRLKTEIISIGKQLIQQGNDQLRRENQVGIEQLLKPFKEQISNFEKEIRDTKKTESERFVEFSTIVQSLSQQHEKMNNTAQNLADALRGEQKFQGDWGELALERILEMSGLQRGVEYHVQHTIRDQAGTIFRPDVVIQLPDDKQLIIDSKVSLKAFEQYIHSETDAEKNLHLQAHLHSLKTHIKQLGEKSYDQLPGINSPEFVLLFIPLESSFALAVKAEPSLYSIAWEKRIVLVTPSTLLATLKTVESIWKQDRQTKHALEIAVQAGRMYDKFVGFVEDLELVSKKQREAQKSMDDAVKKLHTGPGNLAKSAEKLKIMGAKTKKELPKSWQEQTDEETN